MCNLSQLIKNETKHSAYSRAQYTISSLKCNQKKVKCCYYNDSYLLSLISFFSFSFFKQIFTHSWKRWTHSKRKKSSRHIIYIALQPTRYTSRQLSPMTLSLVNLPVEIIYRILDHQSDFVIICTMRQVCQRLNKIVDGYHRYQVNFFFYFVCLMFIHFHNI